MTGKDLPLSTFNCAIERIQQIALSKANSKIPCPEEQLALIRTKKGKAERLKLSFSCQCAHGMLVCVFYINCSHLSGACDIS